MTQQGKELHSALVSARSILSLKDLILLNDEINTQIMTKMT